MIDGLGLQQARAGIDLAPRVLDFGFELGRAGIGRGAEEKIRRAGQRIAGEVLAVAQRLGRLQQPGCRKVEHRLGIRVIAARGRIAAHEHEVLQSQRRRA